MIWCLAFFFLIDLNYVDLFQLHTLKYSLDMWPKISLRGGGWFVSEAYCSFLLKELQGFRKPYGF